jgi:hypothetical protein
VDEDATSAALKTPGGPSMTTLNAARRSAPVIDFLSIVSFLNIVAAYQMDDKVEHWSFNVTFFARNGMFDELIRVKRISKEAGGGLTTAIIVNASFPNKKHGIVLERINHNFPQDALGSDKEWNDFKKLPLLPTGCRAQ